MSARLRNRTISPSRTLRKPLSSVTAWDRSATTSTPARNAQGALPTPFQPSLDQAALSVTSSGPNAEENAKATPKHRATPFASTQPPIASLSSSLPRGNGRDTQQEGRDAVQQQLLHELEVPAPIARHESRSKLSQVMSASSRPATAPSTDTSASHRDAFGIIASDSLLAKAQPPPSIYVSSMSASSTAPPASDLQSSFTPQPMQPMPSSYVRPAQSARFAAPSNSSGTSAVACGMWWGKHSSSL